MKTFAEFYPYYLSEHANRTCRRLHFAGSTLAAKLREEADQTGEEVLEWRRDAWTRLLATFRAVHGGIEHERCPDTHPQAPDLDRDGRHEPGER